MSDSKVSLEEHAGVTAALAEGFTLAFILGNERIAEAAWALADHDWKVRLARDAAEGGPLFAAYRARLKEAEDCLTRATPPIDQDVAAWMSFVHAYSSSASPSQLLAEAGLNLNDMSRLLRTWNRRMVEDRALAIRGAKLAAAPGAAPTVSPAKPELRPFPWSRRKAAVEAKSPSAPASPGPTPELTLDRYAAIHAELESATDELPKLLERHRLDPASFERADREWKRRLSDPALALDFRRLVAHERARLELGDRRRPCEAAPDFAASPSALEAAVPAGMRAFSRVDGTEDASAVPVGPALPFDPSARPRLPARAPVIPGAMRRWVGAAETKDAGDLPVAPALPFVAGQRAPFTAASSDTNDEPTLVAPERAVPRGMRNVSTTFETQDGARPRDEPALPFVASEHVLAVAVPSAAPAAMRRFSSIGGTQGLSDAPRGPVLPFERGDEPPMLSLEHYVWLSADLEQTPDDRAAVLARYRVDEEQRRRLDDYWMTRMAEDARVRAAWEAFRNARQARGGGKGL